MRDRNESARPEDELIARARELHPGAWTEIYSRHHAAIHRYIRARIFDEAIAEDLTSATFVAALQAIGSFRERGRPLLAWLYSIARHKVADRQREAVADRRRMLRLPTWHRTPTVEAEVAQRLDLRRAIVHLPVAQREVLLLRHFVGLSTAEIAEVLGKKPAAVYSLEARALMRLREELSAAEKKISAAPDEKPPLDPINRQMHSLGDQP